MIYNDLGSQQERLVIATLLTHALLSGSRVPSPFEVVSIAFTLADQLIDQSSKPSKEMPGCAPKETESTG